MKKILVSALLAGLIAVSLLPAASALPPPVSDSMLVSLTNNTPNTGIMVPEAFSPYVNSYILTVASWVSRVNFIPVAASSAATILVNGTYIASGQRTADFVMTDKPQAVVFTVTGPSMGTSEYTVFLQRRPSEARTYSSVGYLKKMYVKSGKHYMDFDLVTARWEDGTNRATGFTNESKALYKYPVRNNAILYAGDRNHPFRVVSPADFMSAVSPIDGNALFRVVYLEDEIVAVTPYALD